MDSEQFLEILYSAQVGNALFVIAGALVIIAYVMVSKMSKKRNRS